MMKMIREKWKDNLSFRDNENVERAEEALRNTIKKYEHWFKKLEGTSELVYVVEHKYYATKESLRFINYTVGYDIDTGDVLYFFKTRVLYGLDLAAQTKIAKMILTNAKENWKKANFEIVEERISEDEYYHAKERSVFFRLKPQ